MSLLNRLIEQAKKPSGFIGSSMLGIMNAAHTGMNEWALSYISVKENSNILDIGCGGGKAIQLLSKAHSTAKVFGIDYSEQAVKNAIQVNKDTVATGKVCIVQGNVTEMPFSDHFFDLITAFQTHYFWTDLQSGVKDAFRVLNPNGQFFIVAETYKINYHMTSFKTKEEMKALFEQTGFHSVQFYEHTKRGWLCIKGIK